MEKNWWDYSKETKILLSNYFNDINGWNKCDRLSQELLEYPDSQVRYSLDSKFVNGHLVFKNHDEDGMNRYLKYILRLDEVYKTKNVYKTCRYNSYLNEHVWRTLEKPDKLTTLSR